MGIFPIIMNVLQFWLIDSIVKASAVALTLDSDTPDAFDRADREPLFGGPSDDEEDDPPQHADLENQRHILRSRSSSPLTDSLDKPISGPTTPLDKLSGSSTPEGSVELHEYPPTSGSSPPVIKEATRLNKKRRTAPSPLKLQANVQPAVNSPLLSSTTSTTTTTARQVTPNSSKSLRPIPPKNVEASGKEWAESWDDSDDWANRVGEEEWTGRRMGEKVEALHDVWGNQTTTVQVGS